MKLKTMDIQKFLLTGWYPKMAYNVKRLCDGGFYTQRIFKTAIAKPVLCEVFIFSDGKE